jgi:hypothetical protein
MRRSVVIGILVGWALWAIIFGAGAACQTLEPWFPRWAKLADIPDTLATSFMVAAAPVAVGGWLLIWGDGPQPPAWVKSLPFNLFIALVLYGAMGALIGYLIARRRLKHRELVGWKTGLGE